MGRRLGDAKTVVRDAQMHAEFKLSSLEPET